MLKINIFTQLLSFFALAIVVNQLNLKVLFILLMILFALNWMSKTRQFMHAIKKFRWLFIVMLTIFAFNTPGEHVANWPFAFSPTYEGLQAGVTQILRISSMLAALALILAANSRQQLISGFYFIFLPFKYLGLAVERFAARLWLTLHYVEQQREAHHDKNLMNRLKAMTTLKDSQTYNEVEVVFQTPQFGALDYAVLIALSAACIKVFA